MKKLDAYAIAATKAAKGIHCATVCGGPFGEECRIVVEGTVFPSFRAAVEVLANNVKPGEVVRAFYAESKS